MKKNFRYFRSWWIAACAAGAVCLGCARVPDSRVRQPDWISRAVLYEVNVRQFTPEGTFRALESHLSRLQDLGVDVLWLMPVHPIGEAERKGTLGSYYAVRDYRTVNPEFGTEDDFRHFVEQAHRMGFRVILDWVANHTARDHSWIVSHPDWYVPGEDGTPNAPFDWTDVAELDYSRPELRREMTDCMRYWVETYGIDGFRCDVAGEVPTDYWNEAFAELRRLRPDLFLLAEAERPDLLEDAFGSYYAWEQLHKLNASASGKLDARELTAFFRDHARRFPSNVRPLNFITNHDENSWNGTEFERMGDGVQAYTALTFVLPGLPLIYSGQEVGMDHRLAFFERDPIDWTDRSGLGMTDFFRHLIAYRRSRPALCATAAEAPLEFLKTDRPAQVLALRRTLGDDRVTACFNLSPEPVSFVCEGRSRTLPAWGFSLE